jgi:transcriptional regulator with XRE-family HTH domain
MESENAIADRILAFLRAKEITSGALADHIGVQRSSISHILSGRNKPGFEFLRKFLDAYPEVNAEWFITGRGEMLKQPVQKDLFSGGEAVFDETDENSASDSENITTEEIKEEKGVIPSEHVEKATGTRKMTEDGKIAKVILLYENGRFISYSPGE